MSVRFPPHPVGLGVWPGDGLSFRRDDVARLEKLLWHAAGVGVSWVDTAHVFGDGESERQLGSWLAALPPDVRPAVMTKGGIVLDSSTPHRGATSVLRPSVLHTHLEASLLALRLDAVDAFLLHHPDETGVPIELSWETVSSIVAEGKAVHAGLCAFNLDQVRRCEAVRHVDICMVRLHPLCLRDRLPLLQWCEDHGTDVVVWSSGEVGRLMDPAYAGPLAGTPHDRRRVRLERLMSASLAAEMTAIGVLRGAARRAGIGVDAVAAAWLLAQPGVSGVAVGAESGAQLDRWLSGAGAELSRDDLEQITRASGKARSAPAPVGAVGG